MIGRCMILLNDEEESRVGFWLVKRPHHGYESLKGGENAKARSCCCCFKTKSLGKRNTSKRKALLLKGLGSKSIV